MKYIKRMVRNKFKFLRHCAFFFAGVCFGSTSWVGMIIALVLAIVFDLFSVVSEMELNKSYVNLPPD